MIQFFYDTAYKKIEKFNNTVSDDIKGKKPMYVSYKMIVGLILLRHIDCNNSRAMLISVHEYRDYMSRY